MAKVYDGKKIYTSCKCADEVCDCRCYMRYIRGTDDIRACYECIGRHCPECKASIGTTDDF